MAQVWRQLPAAVREWAKPKFFDDPIEPANVPDDLIEPANVPDNPIEPDYATNDSCKKDPDIHLQECVRTGIVDAPLEEVFNDKSVTRNITGLESFGRGLTSLEDGTFLHHVQWRILAVILHRLRALFTQRNAQWDNVACFIKRQDGGDEKRFQKRLQAGARHDSLIAEFGSDIILLLPLDMGGETT